MRITKKYLTLNQYSRPHRLCHVKGVILHYTGVAGQTAQQCWDYFESLKNQGKDGTYASTQFIVGINGEILQTMEENELAYGVSTPLKGDTSLYPKDVEDVFGRSVNSGALQIEMCFTDKDGKIGEKTLNATAELVADILNRYSIPITSVFTHNECTGKLCPKYFTENKSAYNAFKKKVISLLKPSKSGITDIEILEG